MSAVTATAMAAQPSASQPGQVRRATSGRVGAVRMPVVVLATAPVSPTAETARTELTWAETIIVPVPPPKESRP